MSRDDTVRCNCNTGSSSSSSSTRLSPKLQNLELNATNATKPEIITINDDPPKIAVINPLGAYIAQHPERGNGVFASRVIRPGTVIEDSPVLVITREQWEGGKMDQLILGSYGFCWRHGGMGIGLGTGA